MITDFLLVIFVPNILKVSQERDILFVDGEGNEKEKYS